MPSAPARTRPSFQTPLVPSLSWPGMHCALTASWPYLSALQATGLEIFPNTSSIFLPPSHCSCHILPGPPSLFKLHPACKTQLHKGPLASLARSGPSLPCSQGPRDSPAWAPSPPASITLLLVVFLSFPPTLPIDPPGERPRLSMCVSLPRTSGP